MNNRNYYPFERNNYYSGKVLSAGNFEAEQRYMNDKRRLVNRFIAGSGIVCGMNVIPVDSESISLEMGIAIDGSGREIVVSNPDVKKLSSLPGYSYGKDNQTCYLYVEYDEKALREEQALDNATDKKKYDRVNESYQLYLSEEAPEYDMGNPEYFYKHRQVVFNNENIQVELQTPKYLAAKEKFIFQVCIRTLRKEDDIRLKMVVDLECVRYEGRDKIEIDFDSKKVRKQKNEYIMTYICDCMNIVEDLATFEIEPGKFRLNLNDLEYELDDLRRMESVISENGVEEKVLGEYRASIMNYARRQKKLGVCVAKINVVDRKIDKITRPEGNNSMANGYLAVENEMLKDQIQILKKNTGSNEIRKTEENSNDEYKISSGEVVIPLGIGGEVGKRFFSEEIPHGLGLGNVTIVLSMKDTGSEEQTYVSGSPEIFDIETEGVVAELAVKNYPAKGTFRVGMRLLKYTSEYEAVIHWNAIMQDEKSAYGEEQRIVIDNSVKAMKVMDSTYYSVKFINMPPAELRWSLEDANGGSIDENGCYTAPSYPGVYKIKVECVKNPEIYSTAFIVVKA